MILCDKVPKTVIVSFVEAVEELASKSKAEMHTKRASTLEIGKYRLNAVLDKLNEKNSFFYFEDERVEEEEDADNSTELLQSQKNQLLDLQPHCESYAKTLSVFVFNIGKYDSNLIKNCLLLYLIRQSGIFNRKKLKEQFVLFLSRSATCSSWTY